MDKSKSSFKRKGYWRFWEGAGGWNLKINAVLWHTARQTVYLACLPSHVLRAYCNFESKQANSITLFGRRPNKKESLNTSRKWEWRARINEVGFLRESLGWVRIKCLLSALTSVHGRFPFTNNFRKLPWKGPSSEECVPFDTSSIRLCVRHQNSRW